MSLILSRFSEEAYHFILNTFTKKVHPHPFTNEAYSHTSVLVRLDHKPLTYAKSRTVCMLCIVISLYNWSEMNKAEQIRMDRFGWVCLLLWSSYIIVNAASPAQAKPKTPTSTVSDPLNTLLLQGFNWGSSKSSSSWYNVLKGIVDDAAEAGITDVWFPPPSQSVDREGYLPGKLYDLNSSKYGSEQQLKDAVNAFHQKGIGCVGDIVINHRCGTKQDDKGYWCVFEGGTADGRLDWGPWAVTVHDNPYPCGSGNADTGTDYAAAPDVDHTNPKIQQDLWEWMNWLKSNVRFDGWRFDFAKGYAGNLLGAYIQNTSPKFAVGEVWDDMANGSDGRLAYDQNAHRQRLVDWVHSTGDRAAAFDFTTKGILQEAVNSSELWRLKDSNGRPAGLIGVLPQKAVTFIDNHDTGSPQNKWPFPSDKLLQGYAYILTHPGSPTIFYDHFVDGNLKSEIQNLMAIRKRNNINANSNCTIITAEGDLYMAAIDGNIVMKIGSRYNVGNLAPPATQFPIVASGNDYCVWERNSAISSPAVLMDLTVLYNLVLHFHMPLLSGFSYCMYMTVYVLFIGIG